MATGAEAPGRGQQVSEHLETELEPQEARQRVLAGDRAMSDLPTMLTVQETARAVRRGRKAVYRMIQTGKLRAMRFAGGGPWLVFEDSVSSLLGVREKRRSRPKRDVQPALAAMARLGVQPSQPPAGP